MTAKFDVKDAQYATKLALCSLVYMSLVWYNRNIDSVSADIMVCRHTPAWHCICEIITCLGRAKMAFEFGLEERLMRQNRLIYGL